MLFRSPSAAVRRRVARRFDHSSERQIRTPALFHHFASMHQMSIQIVSEFRLLRGCDKLFTHR
jgi:hypothetical protein